MLDSKFDKKEIAIMQGRLVKSEKKGEIQFFPKKQWMKELELFKRNNFRYIEWVATSENLNKNPIFINESLSLIKKNCKKNKVTIRSIDAQFFIKEPFFKGSSNSMKKNFNKLKKLLINSQKLSIKNFIIPVLEEARLNTRIDETRLINGIKQLSKFLKKKNFILIESDAKPLKLLKLIQSINLRNVGLNYDIGNSAGNKYNFDSEKKYFKYVKNVHLKDKDSQQKSVRLGNGNADFKNIFRYLKKIRYGGTFGMQAARAKNNFHLAEINTNFKFLRKYL
jgi:L-ribulose-5-phosphate 3-epimerase